MKTLYNLRQQKDETQQQIANLLGVTRQCYNRYENGERECSYDTLIKLADHFNVSIDFLLDRQKSTEELTSMDSDLAIVIEEMNKRNLTPDRFARLTGAQLTGLFDIIESFLNSIK